MKQTRTVVDSVYRWASDVLPDPWSETWRAYRTRDDFRRAGVVFVHVPRTAGLSVSRTLYNRDIHHFTIGQLQAVLPDDVLGLPRFTVVRNPWDRAVSAYHFARQGGVPGGAQMSNPERYRGNDFDSFDTFVTRYLTHRRLSRADGVFRPQTSYLTLGDGTLPFDHIGRFEHLADTEQWLSGILGRRIEFPRINGTEREGYREYFTDQTRDIVGSLYRSDVETFGFTF